MPRPPDLTSELAAAWRSNARRVSADDLDVWVVHCKPAGTEWVLCAVRQSPEPWHSFQCGELIPHASPDPDSFGRPVVLRWQHVIVGLTDAEANRVLELGARWALDGLNPGAGNPRLWPRALDEAAHRVIKARR